MKDDALHVQIHKDIDVSRAVMQTQRSARKVGFSADLATLISTATSELARNIIKYAGTGEMIIRVVEDDSRVGLEIEARDRGPGIEDIEHVMQDHVSSSGTLGLGLPGVKRMMDRFDIESVPGQGTKVRAIKWM